MESLEYNIPILFNQVDRIDQTNPLDSTNNPMDVLIKRIIKEQGYQTCREEFFKEYIHECLTTFKHGFVILGKMAQIGKSYKSTASKIQLKGFILFDVDLFKTTISSKILCAKKRRSNW